jgi:hypothetical protein
MDVLQRLPNHRQNLNLTQPLDFRSPPEPHAFFASAKTFPSTQSPPTQTPRHRLGSIEELLGGERKRNVSHRRKASLISFLDLLTAATWRPNKLDAAPRFAAIPAATRAARLPFRLNPCQFGGTPFPCNGLPSVQNRADPEPFAHPSHGLKV